MEITVVNRQRSHAVERGELASFLQQAADLCPPDEADSLALALVSDRRMREYNREYRGLDRTTDVLSFHDPDRAEAPVGERHLGDIVISVPRAESQAVEAGHSLGEELRWLALHGYLHLMGYDHETDDGTMMRVQRQLWRRLRASREAG